MVQQLDSTPETSTDVSTQLRDPYIIKAAQYIYQKCYEIYPKKAEQTQGVAIDRETYRGQLIFQDNPILLPWESFIPSEQLHSEALSEPSST
ncbi:MAG: hypothetical protein BRC33_08870 [Cyanobacteria bacterium SW_9_44_58]|nr:MAG: hypothetical protein BRC33_08870 [Cyanobacteria bacterium SW_9_44_58]